MVLGKKLASGGFGAVFLGELRQPDGTMLPVVIKKASEFGAAEVRPAPQLSCKLRCMKCMLARR